jgi:predicted nucleic-acid-binding Zn-ribbon protein
MKRINLSNLFGIMSKDAIIDDNDRCEYTEFFVVESPTIKKQNTDIENCEEPLT